MSAELRKPWKKSALLKCICCLQNIANLSEWEQSILYIMMKSKRETICISQLSYHCVRRKLEPSIRKWAKQRMSIFFFTCFQESMNFSTKLCKIFLYSMHIEYLVCTIYICKILSTVTFSLQSCIWLKSLKTDQKTAMNGTAQPISFLPPFSSFFSHLLLLMV